MSVYNQAAAYRRAVLGDSSSDNTTIAGSGTYQLFTVSGGDVLVTSLYGRVTTAIAAAGETLLVQVDPTAGTTTAVSTVSADIGTTDTVAGELITGLVDQSGAVDRATLTIGAGEPLSFIAPTGEIEMVVGGAAAADGAITWYATWVPLQDGATLVASA